MQLELDLTQDQRHNERALPTEFYTLCLPLLMRTKVEHLVTLIN